MTKLDRLTRGRSPRPLGRFGGSVLHEPLFSCFSVSDSIDTRSAAGRLVLNVLASVSQWEREATGERTREALTHLRREGVRLGRDPLGLRRLGETDAEGRRILVASDGEQRTVARIRELRHVGLSLRAIASTLGQEGHTTKRGGRWQAETVRKVLVRAA